MIRIGHGFDVHAFGEDRPLIIGGVKVPYHTGFIAHSDGDVALHALTDALLGAAALGILVNSSLIPIRNIKMQIVVFYYEKHSAKYKQKAIRSVMWM